MAQKNYYMCVCVYVRVHVHACVFFSFSRPYSIEIILPYVPFT